MDTTDWSDAANWSAGVPTPTTTANLVYPAGDVADILIGSDASVLGLIYGADLTYYKFLVTGAGAKLTIGAGGIINNSTGVGRSIDHSAATILGASSTFNAGTLGLTLSGTFNIRTNTLTVASSTGALILQGGTSFEVSSLSTYGRITGPGTVELSGALDFIFDSPLGVGTWDFINQTPAGTLTSVQLGGYTNASFIETTPGNWDATAGGLTWNYKANTGVLSVIPEPATALLFGFGGLGAWMLRRNKAKSTEEMDD